MYTSHGVPVKASANRCGENLAITVVQCQRVQRVQRPHNPAVVVDIGGFGDESSSARGKLHRNRAPRELLACPLSVNLHGPPITLLTNFFVPSALRFQPSDFGSSEHTICISNVAFSLQAKFCTCIQNSFCSWVLLRSASPTLSHQTRENYCDGFLPCSLSNGVPPSRPF